MNSDVFSFNRFTKYLKFELKSAYDNFGLSLLILSCINLIAFLFVGVVGYVDSDNYEWYSIDSQFNDFLYSVCTCILIITMPRKCYGYLTEKKAGTSFLMVPVSTLEKVLSMITVCGIIIPAIFFAVSLGLDWLTSEFDSGKGTSIIEALISQTDKIFPWDDGVFSILAGLCSLCLLFLLGAIYFKRSKGGKTILCILAIVVAIILIFYAVVKAYGNETIAKMDSLNFGDGAVMAIKAAISLVICLLIYWRVRTLKH